MLLESSLTSLHNALVSLVNDVAHWVTHSFFSSKSLFLFSVGYRVVYYGKEQKKTRCARIELLLFFSFFFVLFLFSFFFWILFEIRAEERLKPL